LSFVNGIPLMPLLISTSAQTQLQYTHYLCVCVCVCVCVARHLPAMQIAHNTSPSSKTFLLKKVWDKACIVVLALSQLSSIVVRLACTYFFRQKNSPMGDFWTGFASFPRFFFFLA
jgi:hypothetical protein